MSVIANHVRLSDDTLAQWCEDPNLLQQFRSGGIPDVEYIDLDKSWEAIAWLLSECKREEKKRESDAFPDTDNLDPDDDAAWDDAFDNAAVADYADLKPDLLLIAVEGRGNHKESRIDYGYGPACIIDNATVQQINSALQNITAEHLRRQYDPELMDRQMVSPEIWGDEGLAALEDYVAPYFNRLRDLYRNAATSDQKVVVFFS